MGEAAALTASSPRWVGNRGSSETVSNLGDESSGQICPMSVGLESEEINWGGSSSSIMTT